ncbi:hypothetical protein MMC32_006844 [Xylographa parallela]|nr:hypothetical protein [Xylographa parallela]
MATLCRLQVYRPDIWYPSFDDLDYRRSKHRNHLRMHANAPRTFNLDLSALIRQQHQFRQFFRPLLALSSPIGLNIHHKGVYYSKSRSTLGSNISAAGKLCSSFSYLLWLGPSSGSGGRQREVSLASHGSQDPIILALPTDDQPIPMGTISKTTDVEVRFDDNHYL